MHRKIKVPEAEVPVVECFHCSARITSKELATIHSVKSGILQNACSSSPRVVAVLAKKCSYAHRQVEEQLVKRSKKNGDKSAVAMLKIHDNWVVFFKTWSRRSCHQSYGRAQTCRNQSDVLNSQKPLYVTQTFETKILRSEWFDQVNLISVSPILRNLRIGLRKRQSDKSDVPVKQRVDWLKVKI